MYKLGEIYVKGEKNLVHLVEVTKLGILKSNMLHSVALTTVLIQSSVYYHQLLAAVWIKQCPNPEIVPKFKFIPPP